MLDIPPRRPLWGLLRINAAGQRFVATPTLLGRIGDDRRFVWRAVLFAFGQSGSNLAPDVNGDGVVDDADLLAVLFAFGDGC